MRLISLSQVVISIAIILVIGTVSSIFVFKVYTSKAPLDDYVTLFDYNLGSTICSLANAIQIQVSLSLPVPVRVKVQVVWRSRYPEPDT